MLLSLVCTANAPASSATCPMHAAHETAAHLTGVMQRGTSAMGFSQTASAHHFVLTTGGGIIEVTANKISDLATRDAIRMHLSHIAQMFTAGDFNVPMFIHGVTPPGVPTMKALRAQIRYLYDPIVRGGRVNISTSNTQALQAIHAFLAFQIRDHNTHDSTTVVP
jgi:hypothetical protein